MHTCVAVLLVGIAGVLCTGALQTHAFAFDLHANTHRCFVEEVPTDVEMRMAYAALPGYAQFLDVTVTGPGDNVLFGSNGQDRGKFHEHIHEGGDFTICFHSRLAHGAKYSAGMKRTISVDIRVGGEINDYAELATKEKLRPIEVELRVLEDTVRSIYSEYLYYKEKEAEMRNSNEAMTFKVTLFTGVIIVIFILFSLWELRHLKSYFRKKRLID